MLKEAVPPPKLAPSSLGAELPHQRVADMPGIVSVEVKELFPEIPDPIYSGGEDVSPIRKATERALAGVDMSMIKADHSINILCTEHGFSMLGGFGYAEMLKTIKDVVQDRTGCEDIRLRLTCTIGKTEARELIPLYGLDQYFNGRASGAGPFDRGVPIETEIGTLYGVARVYNADWIIHSNYNDPREVHFHRLIERGLKAFGMNYARHETRSIYHMNFGSRSSSLVSRAIFDSAFVQKKFAFACCQNIAPSGIIGFDADNDMYRQNRRLIINTVKWYGKLMRLFAGIDECIPVLDGTRWLYYQQAGGLCFCSLLTAPTDFIDLEVGSPQKPIPEQHNPAIKAIVANYVWRGFPEAFFGVEEWYPIILCPNMARGLFENMEPFTMAENLQDALEKAQRIGKTDKIIVFDGNFGSINLSPSMGEFLLKKAPEISRKVDKELAPLWLKQRGIDPDAI